jgi:hypothetical protein
MREAGLVTARRVPVGEKDTLSMRSERPTSRATRPEPCSLVQQYFMKTGDSERRGPSGEKASEVMTGGRE